MQHFIGIDLNSIRVNPRAGETRTVIPGLKTIKISGVGDAENLEAIKNHDGIILTDVTTYFSAANGRTSFEATMVAKNQDAIEDVKKYMEKYSVGIEQDAHVCNHNPLPKWLYEHEDIKITCSACDSESNLSACQSKERGVLYDDDTDTWSDVWTCPKCGDSSVEDFYFESIDEALKRLEDIKK
jgi:hypothetical protein